VQIRNNKTPIEAYPSH